MTSSIIHCPYQFSVFEDEGGDYPALSKYGESFAVSKRVSFKMLASSNGLDC